MQHKQQQNKKKNNKNKPLQAHRCEFLLDNYHFLHKSFYLFRFDVTILFVVVPLNTDLLTLLFLK